MKKLAAILLLTSMLFTLPALAETDLNQYNIANGNVTATHFIDVVAPCSGTLESFDLNAGDSVSVGSTLFTMQVNTLYASEDGIVGAIYAQPGDDAQLVMNRYGAVLALEGNVRQQLTATTTGAYNDDKNRTIHVGETLYFKSSKTNGDEGSGRVVAVSGSNYVVDILSGSFDSKSTMTLYRSSNRNNKDNVGKGIVVNRDPVMLPGSGRVANVLVNEGDTVTRGQALMTFLAQDADVDAVPEVLCPTDGVVASVAVSPCQQVWKGALLARIYLTDELEIVAQVDEMDLNGLRVGDIIPCTLDIDESKDFDGTVTEISKLGVTQQNAAYYAVHVSIDHNKAMLGASASIYLERK